MPNMPNLDNVLHHPTAKGVAIGVGVALLGLAALPTLFSMGRPFVRQALKSGLLLVEKSREVIAEAGEAFEDLVAEVRAELVAERGHFAAEETVAEDIVEDRVAE